MDQAKPFKTIEIVDKATGQVCKVACMSCIRGHRTISCGIPICRTKIFWTVKRPGRPAKPCTCRLNASGVCRCVTAIPKCTHKLKKGEKRSAACRCDEQGRSCCLLEPQHWQSLFALEKPSVQLYHSKDALEEAQQSVYITSTRSSATSTPILTQQTHTTSNCSAGQIPDASTNLTTPRLSRLIAPSPHGTTSSPAITQPLVPHFGFIGLDTPTCSDTDPRPGFIARKHEVLVAPRAYPPAAIAEESMGAGSCCGQTRMDDYQLAAKPDGTMSPAHLDSSFATFVATPAISEPYRFDFDRWNHDFQMYQLPNAICQNCGLNGCTCRSCPPLMQNFGTTSWAQSCGRRHARMAPVHQQSSTVQHDVQHTQALHDSQPYDHNLPLLGDGEALDTISDMIIDMHNHDIKSPRTYDLPFHSDDHAITNEFQPTTSFILPQAVDSPDLSAYFGPMPDSPTQATDSEMFGDCGCG